MSEASAAPAHLSTYQQELWRELDYMELSAEYSFQGHMNDHKADAKTHSLVGVLATIATTIGAAGILTELFPLVAGFIALGGAVLTGIMTFMKKSELASKSLAASHGCSQAVAKFRQAKKLKLGVIPDEEVLRIIEDVTGEYNEANGMAGAIRKKSYLEAKEAFRSGQRAGRTAEEVGG
ncbi:SLATT domain-containing protein [Arthrobacter crystallopoietes]|uniref:SLATT domain-containing protein n=1 Tax=Crystallibacter crystallopoietes TaxID=37928 RepID=UPI003D23AC60